jgi:hypothetical protein
MGHLMKHGVGEKGIERYVFLLIGMDQLSGDGDQM